MRKLTFVFVLSALLISTVTIAAAGFAYEGDPQVKWPGSGRVARILANTGAQITVYNAERVLNDHGFSVTTENGPVDKVCVEQSAFEVHVRNFNSGPQDRGDCVVIPGSASSP